MFLTLLITVYVGNVSFFVHEHKVGDVTIVHSHPYSSSSHNHSDSSISTLSWISHFNSLPVADTSVIEVFVRLLCVFVIGDEIDLVTGVESFLTLRAPPIL